MNKFMIAMVGAVALLSSACKKKGGAGEAVAKMEEFQKKMCDCKDKACADKVNEEMTKWGTEMAKTASKDAKPDPEVAKKSADIMTKYTECMTKNMTAGGGGSAGGGAAPGGGSATVAGGGAGGKCPDGFTLAGKGSFCIKLPAGVTGDGGAGMEVGNNKAMQYGWAGGKKGSDFGITVKVWPISEHYADNKARVKNPPYQGKMAAEGKVGEEGAWASGESGPPPAGFNQRHWINAVNKSDKMQLDCNVTRANGTDAPTQDEVFEACKTIQFPK